MLPDAGETKTIVNTGDGRDFLQGWSLSLKPLNNFEKKFSNPLPNVNSENYFEELLVYKDKNYRKKEVLPNIESENTDEYIKLSIDIHGDLDEIQEEKTDGVLCKKCKKRSGIITSKQLRAGDEGSALVIQCTNKNCHHMEKLSS